MEITVELYMDPVAIVLNPIDLKNEVMLQLQQDLEGGFLGNVDTDSLPDQLGTDMYSGNIGIDDIAPYLTVNTNSLWFEYAEEDALVYSVKCNLDVDGLLSTYYI